MENPAMDRHAGLRETTSDNVKNRFSDWAPETKQMRPPRENEDMDWIAYCTECGELDRAPNGAMIEARARLL